VFMRSVSLGSMVVNGGSMAAAAAFCKEVPRR
jgi:hypothetical protein